MPERTTDPKKVCNRFGCQQVGLWSPVFMFYAPDPPYKDMEPIEATIGLKLCDEHRDQFDSAQFLPTLQLTVTEGCHKLGKPIPDWSKTKIRFEDPDVTAAQIKGLPQQEPS